MNLHELPETEKEKHQILTIVANQTREVLQDKTLVSCGFCGLKRRIVHCYRCFYCGILFCTSCSAIHFKTDKEQGRFADDGKCLKGRLKELGAEKEKV